MKRLIYSATIFLALFATACSGGGKSSNSDSDSSPKVEQQAPSTEVATDSGKEYKLVDGTIVSANDLPMIVDFSAEWCPPCKQLKPIFEDLKREYTGKVDFVTINVDSMPELAKKYGVESIPNMVFVSPEGKELYRSIGFREASQIRDDISKYMKQ